MFLGGILFNLFLVIIFICKEFGKKELFRCKGLLLEL